VAIGVSTAAIKHRVAVRRLRRVDECVYAIGHRLTAQGRCMSAVLGSARGAVLSHRSAAAAWDLRQWPAGPVEVTVPRLGARSRPGVVVHGTRHLDQDELTVRDGIPCTTVARTLVDLAAVALPREMKRALEQSLVLHLYDGRAMEAVLSRSNGRRGVKVLRRLLTDLHEPAPTNRELERRLLDLIRDANLPLPAVNAHIGEHQVDFHWPEHRLVVETDGHTYHSNPIALARDRRRDLDLELSGWHVLRLGWRQVVHEPGRVKSLLAVRLTAR